MPLHLVRGERELTWLYPTLLYPLDYLDTPPVFRHLYSEFLCASPSADS